MTARETLDLPGLRRRAWEDFRAAAPPSKSSEAWRRADFGQWRLDALVEAAAAGLSGARPGGGGAGAQPLGGAAGVFRQEAASGPSQVELSGEARGQGVVLSTIEEALGTHPRLVEAALIRCAGPDFSKLEAANLAGFVGGAFLYVPRGVKLAAPFDISFLHAPDTAYAFPRTLVVLEDGAAATVFEDHPTSEGPARAVAAFSRVRVGCDAALRYFYNQCAGASVSSFWSQRVDLGAGARLEHYSILFGGAVHKSDLQVELAGRGARSELYGVVFGSKRQLFDARTAQLHRADRTWSDLLYKTALRERARAVYTGLIRVEKEAVGSDAYQQNNNLLLSDTARADTTPVLEILTDQVRCKHGATMGPVNPEELFYLGCRGLEPKEAARTLVMGFFEPILKHVPLERLRDQLPAEVERRLA